jgi:phosphatidylethanolamine/phosphatidyl-N-methylethanolamine N-methyltransferase
MVTEELRTEPDKAATTTIQRRYDRQASTYDLFEAPMELLMARWRRRLWDLLPPDARVLEVGVGTGKNLRWHPPGISITAVDFSPQMLSRAVSRAKKQSNGTQFALMDAQALALDDGAFDAAVATCVFCSVPDPVLGLREIRRVLRPEGRLLLLEHVRSELPVVGRSMDLLNPVTVRMSGTNINRRTLRNVERAGFRVLDVDDLFLDIVKLIVAQPQLDP